MDILKGFLKKKNVAQQKIILLEWAWLYTVWSIPSWCFYCLIAGERGRRGEREGGYVFMCTDFLMLGVEGQRPKISSRRNQT